MRRTPQSARRSRMNCPVVMEAMGPGYPSPEAPTPLGGRRRRRPGGIAGVAGQLGPDLLELLRRVAAEQPAALGTRDDQPPLAQLTEVGGDGGPAHGDELAEHAMGERE